LNISVVAPLNTQPTDQFFNALVFRTGNFIEARMANSANKACMQFLVLE
jgi:hypothetical protein